MGTMNTNAFWILSALNLALLLYFFIRDIKQKQSPKKQAKKLASSHVEEELLIPARQKVSLLHIQLVGINKLADEKKPLDGIKTYRSLMEEVDRQVSSMDGLCIRRPPSGLLCVFGLSYDNQAKNDDSHVQKAISAATEIQRDNAKRNIVARSSGSQVVPFSIGVHTAEVLIGSLTYKEPLEILVSGVGVEVVEKLSVACEKHLVMVSEATFHLMKNIGWAGSELKLREVQGLLKGDCFQAYEIDPFVSTSQTLNEAEAAHRQFTGAVRGEERWKIDDKYNVEIKVQGAKGKLIDFSNTGFALDLDRYFSVGSYLNVSLSELSTGLSEKLLRYNLNTILCEVMWAKALQNGKFLHGVKFVELSAELKSKEMLGTLLKSYLSSEVIKKSA